VVVGGAAAIGVALPLPAGVSVSQSTEEAAALLLRGDGRRALMPSGGGTL